MKLLLCLFTVLTLAGTLTASAQDNPVVVELYTSQGCSSCPAADAILKELADREDVIALGLHVDYWDYIGWKDRFAHPSHAERQRAYARKAGRRSIYTPEMIVQGQTDIVGAKPMKLGEAITVHANRPRVVDLKISRTGDTLQIAATAVTPPKGDVTVLMLRYAPRRETVIDRGENQGQTLEYHNIVEGLQVLGQWDGASPLSMSAQMSGSKPVVVILQASRTGPILAAARLR